MTDAISAFILIFIAEMGDKSQLACMLLASRYKKLPVILGASVAFALLNLLAIVFGAVLAQSLPRETVLLAVALLFAFFGVKTLLESDELDVVDTETLKSVFYTALTMTFVAELGDKTQVSVAALGASADPLLTYLGATSALIMTSILGALAGERISKYVDAITIKRIAGSIFIAFSVWVSYELMS